MYYYYFWTELGLLPLTILHDEYFSKEEMRRFRDEALGAGATSIPKVFDYLVQKHGFVKPKVGGSIYVEFPE